MHYGQHLKRSVLLSLLFFTTLLLSPHSFAETTSTSNQIPTITNFQSIVNNIQQENKPLLLEFKADYCNFCKRLEAEHLQGLYKNKEKKLLIRSFDIETTDKIIDFDGKTISSTDFQKRYKASFTPLVVFLDSNGKQIADRLEGYGSSDYYGAYLEQSIEQAQTRLTHKKSHD